MKGKILNKLTGRWILKNGKLAKKLGLSPKRKRVLKGGDSGVTGTVITPAIPCVDPQQDMTGFSSKIFHNADEKENRKYFDYETRPLLLEKLRRIDPEQKHFIYALPFRCNTINLTDLSSEYQRKIASVYGGNLGGKSNTSQITYFNLKTLA
jgi:hypothetical protein